MKLINKKTGEVIDLDIANIKAQFGAISVIPEPVKLGGDEYVYHSLAELNSEWEDYKPAEPLIKDEKIRKAVRAWAEANNFLDEIEVHSLTAGTRFSIGHYDIEFLGYFIYDLESNKTYTIDELCGEEER